MQHLKFNCGCSFPVLDGKVTLSLEPEEINYDCRSTWSLISSGNTKGIFQIESNLGQQCCKSAPVKSIEDLGAIVAIMRPGCTESFLDDGKNLTTHYLLRKSGKEQIEYYHPSLEPILKDTMGILIYQESALRIAKEIAGLSGSESETLRKAIGKKDTVLMAKVKTLFIEGCKIVGKINDKEAEDIFSWIEASQRFSFNKSHSISYSYLAYVTAYIKEHFPKEFFVSWLSHAEDKIDKQEEIRQLVQNSRSMKFEIHGPSIHKLNRHFTSDDNGIHFGFTEIKSVGQSVFDKLIKIVDELETKIGPKEKWSYLDIIIRLLPQINSAAAKSLIMVGAFRNITNNRTKLSYELDCFTKLSPKEIEWIESNYKAYTDLVGVIRGLYDTFKFKVKARKPKVLEIINSLERPPYSLEDTAASLAGEEKRLLGVSLSCSAVDSCDTSEATHSCLDFTTMKVENAALAVHIDGIKEFTIKKGNFAGKKMAKISISDASGSLEVVSFTDSWTRYRSILTAGNTILAVGTRSKKDGNFILNSAKQI